MQQHAKGHHHPSRGFWFSFALLSNLVWSLAAVAVLAAYMGGGPRSIVDGVSSRVALEVLPSGRVAAELTVAAGKLTPQDLTGGLSIPKILHHVYIGEGKMPEKNAPFIKSCRLHHSPRSGWQYQLWDEKASVKLLRKVDPQFYTKVYKRYRPVQKADAIRPYIMKHIGGLYLDSDTECWREGSDMLEGHDLVLQGHHGTEALANGMMASVPGHPFWDHTIGLMKQRTAQAFGHPDIFSVLNTTGPILLRDAVLSYFNTTLDKAGFVRKLKGPRAERVILRPIGTWYIPCTFVDKRCIAEMQLARGFGRAPLHRLAGMHHYSVGWWAPNADAKHSPQREDFKSYLCNETFLVG